MESELDSTSEVAPRDRNQPVKLRSTEKRCFTTKYAEDLLDHKMSFQSDSSDFFSEREIDRFDSALNSSSEVNPANDQINVKVHLRKVPKVILTPDNIPDLFNMSTGSSEGDDEDNFSSESSSLQQNNEKSKLKKREMKNSSLTSAENGKPKDLSALNDPVTRKVTIAHLAAFALAGYTTFYQGKENVVKQ